MAHNRMRKLELAVTGIQKRWGTRSIRRASQADPIAESAVLSTGFPVVDKMLGTGGLARGHIAELIGSGTAGQMTLAAKTLSQAQAARQQIVYIDTFQTIDLDFLARCGVYLKPLVVLRPLGFGHAIEMVGDLLRGGGAGAIVLDRLHPSMAWSQELQLFTHVLPEWNALLDTTLCTLLILSETILPEDYPYGTALPHFSHARLGFQWQQWTYQGQRCSGFISQVTILKNRSGPWGASHPIKITFEKAIEVSAQ